MTIEQKSKRYDEALERAKKVHKYSSDLAEIKHIEQIFPELIGSGDEQYCKWILEYLYDGLRKSDEQFKGQFKAAIAWLEKQDNTPKETTYTHEVETGNGYIKALVTEEIPIDKVEPKFKVGNWYQCIKDFFGKGVTFDKNTAYYCAKEGCLQDEYGCHIAIVKDLYDNFKLWTIQDAKDGDVLTTPNYIYIFNSIDEKTETVSFYCLMKKSDEHFSFGDYKIQDEILNSTPSTKEERDLLFSKMKEAGYEWDDEKKRVKKIENEIEIPFGAKDSELQEVTYYIPKGFHAEIDDDKVVIKKGEKSTAWSEEDECLLEDCLEVLHSSEKYGIGHKVNIINWIYSIKQRLGE